MKTDKPQNIEEKKKFLAGLTFSFGSWFFGCVSVVSSILKPEKSQKNRKKIEEKKEKKGKKRQAGLAFSFASWFWLVVPWSRYFVFST